MKHYVRRLKWTEMIVIRWMCSLSNRHGIKNGELKERIGVECISLVTRRVRSMESDCWEREIKVAGTTKNSS